jgi:O-succinylbenzoic acid--CoA ligase
MDTGSKINWHDEKSNVLLNPRLSEFEKNELLALARQYALPAHVWIASSGSSKAANQSLKLIALSKKAFLASAQAVNQHLASHAKDVWLQNLPTFHVGGLSIEARAFLSGAKVVKESTWDPERFIQVTESENVTLSALVPTQIFDLVQTGQKAPGSLRAIVIGGAALAEDLYQKAIALNWPVLPSYGMTECCSQIATASLDNWRLGKRDLQLLSHIDARVTEQGQLQVRSPSLLTGFAQMVDGVANWTDPKLEGWYQAQDLVQLRGRTLIPLGRGSDFVKIMGEGVDLQKLRNILDQVAQDVCPQTWQNFNLSTVPDSRLGHRLILQVLSGPDASNVRDQFNQRVAPFERIQELQTVTDLPWKKKSPKAW